MTMKKLNDFLKDHHDLNPVKKHCEKHGIDYQCNRFKAGKRIIEGLCPECQKELEQQKNQEEMEKKALERQQRLASQFQRSGIPPRYTTRTFDNFKAETTQQEKALNMAQAYMRNIQQNMNTGAGLILAGKPGTGKTHLACAIGGEYMNHGTVLFITVSAMIRRIRASYQRNSDKTEQDVIDELRDVDLLIVDEIGIQKGSESEEHLLFEVINDRYSYFKPIILISNLNAEEIKKYIGERALDRMREGGGKFISFDWESYRPNVAGDELLPGLDESKYQLNNPQALRKVI